MICCQALHTLCNQLTDISRQLQVRKADPEAAHVWPLPPALRTSSQIGGRNAMLVSRVSTDQERPQSVVVQRGCAPRALGAYVISCGVRGQTGPQP